jgi:hypothetical protein
VDILEKDLQAWGSRECSMGLIVGCHADMETPLSVLDHVQRARVARSLRPCGFQSVYIILIIALHVLSHPHLEMPARVELNDGNEVRSAMKLTYF